MKKVIEILKLIVAFIVSVGVGAVAENLLSIATDKEANKVVKASMWIGGIAIAGLAASAAGTHVENAMDKTEAKISESIQQQKDEIEKVKEIRRKIYENSDIVEAEVISDEPLNTTEEET